MELTAWSWYLDCWANAEEPYDLKRLTVDCQFPSVDKKIQQKWCNNRSESQKKNKKEEGTPDKKWKLNFSPEPRTPKNVPACCPKNLKFFTISWKDAYCSFNSHNEKKNRNAVSGIIDKNTPSIVFRILD